MCSIRSENDKNVADDPAGWPIQATSVGKPIRSRTTEHQAPELRSRPGTDLRLVGQGPRKASVSDQITAARTPATLLQSSDGSRISDAPAASIRRKRRDRPPLDATNGPKDRTSAGRRSICFSNGDGRPDRHRLWRDRYPSAERALETFRRGRSKLPSRPAVRAA